MLILPAYDTSGFKSITQLSSWKNEHVTFSVSPRRPWPSCDCKRWCHSHSCRTRRNAALPINQIPFELLCDIFCKFLEADLDLPDHTPVAGLLVSLHSRADPTILGQVCSRWRSVALSTPALWANICILEPKRAQIPRTRLWLERARSHTLNIALEERRKFGFDLVCLGEILLAFASRRHLWKRVNFFIPNVALETLMVAITTQPHDFRNLESVSLCIGSQQPSQKVFIDAVWKAFHSSPALHEVDWRGAYYNELPIHAPWAQLTHLNLQSDFDAESLTDILLSCPKIRVLFIFRLSSMGETKRYLEHIVLESLHTLNLEVEVETHPLFERLTLPSLRSLDIRYRYFDRNSPRDFVAFQECLIRSDCSLRQLAFYDENLEEGHLQAFLRSPGLRHVTVLDLQVPVSDKVIQSLTTQTNDGHHESMPLLEEMTLSIRTSSDGLLAQMASSRCTNLTTDKDSKTLKRLTLEKDDEYGIEDRLGLSKLFYSGLQGSMA